MHNSTLCYITRGDEVLMLHPWVQYIQRFLLMFAYMNLGLAVFNLLPLPPLDGYHVFNDLILKGKLFLSEKAFRIGMIVVLILSWQGVLGRIISAVVYPAQDLVLALIRLIWG